MPYGLLKRTVTRNSMSRGAEETTTWVLQESWGCLPEATSKQLEHARNYPVLAMLNSIEDMGWTVVCKEDPDTYVIRRT